MGRSIQLSVVVITYNEEHNIKRCLDSVVEIADEIVLVDSFSKDRTEEIARSYNVKWIQNPFGGHIEQKNFAMQQASNDYVLSLDADESLSPELLSEIKKIKIDCRHDGYIFNRLNNYCGKWIRYSGWYPDKKLRLWNKNKGRWGGVNPHDRVEMQKDSSVLRVKKDILHYSYYSIEEHFKQSDYFSTIAAKQALQRGKRATLLHVIISPAVRFVKNYFIKFGFLDGYYGLVIASLEARANFYKYLKIWKKEA